MEKHETWRLRVNIKRKKDASYYLSFHDNINLAVIFYTLWKKHNTILK